ncbi:3-ketoacyl-CoA thiolase 2, peroxisomal [Platanthera guangdongensis]|uniref:3-ketoacyl-CoA thiolase 2, peroxisomal n=1 Tax=Platanthera guangdongensis TaxID=2320717 RepID=A0ABR2M7G7_9ASPA
MEKSIERQRVLLQHLQPPSSAGSSLLSASVCAAGDSAAYHSSPSFGDDVVVVAAYRTPICKAKRGGFKDTHPEDLLATVLKALVEKTNLNPNEVGDIVVGTVLAPEMGEWGRQNTRMSATAREDSKKRKPE